MQFKQLCLYLAKLVSSETLFFIQGENSIKQFLTSKKLAEYQNHAHKDVMERDLSNYDAIVIVSGDGLIHEVLKLDVKISFYEYSQYFSFNTIISS